MEPVTIFLTITSIISFLSTGFNWLKNALASDSSLPVPLSIGTQTSRPIILPPPPRTNDDISKSEYENNKNKKEVSSNSKSNDHKSSSNSGSIMILILCIIVILGIMSFLIYQKRNKLKENQLKFGQIDSPSSLRTTQTDLNSIIV